MHKNNFDIVMAHIEENVNQPTAQIKKEIANLIGRHSRAFDEHFQILTGYTLDYYIKQRRLNYAARDLVRHQEKSICDIASEYQFSDQSAFTRAIKAKYGVTPNEIRKEWLCVFEERFCFDDFTGKKNDTEVAKLLRSMEIDAPWDVEYMLEIEQLNDRFGFDIDVCYQMADLAERLGISLQRLAEYCIQATAVEEIGLAEMKEIVRMHNIMSAWNIASEEELEAICTYYKCEYYELDQLKVYLYQKEHSKK
jgi:AraC-like DNA-binding protein